MPITLPRQVPRIEAPAATPAPQITRADVEAMLTQRDEQWRQQMRAMAEAFSSALASAVQAAKPEPAPPRKGSRVTFNYDVHGFIVNADIFPKE